MKKYSTLKIFKVDVVEVAGMVEVVTTLNFTYLI